MTEAVPKRLENVIPNPRCDIDKGVHDTQQQTRNDIPAALVNVISKITPRIFKRGYQQIQNVLYQCQRKVTKRANGCAEKFKGKRKQTAPIYALNQSYQTVPKPLKQFAPIHLFDELRNKGHDAL